MATEFPDETSVRVTRTIDASLDRVWQAFVDPSDMAAWMWAGWGSDTTAAADLRIGGRYEVYTTSPRPDPNWSSDRWGFYGYYTAIDAPSRLSYTLHWDGPVGYNQTGEPVADEAVIINLQTADGGTRMDMWHIGIPAVAGAAAEHGRGIEAEFDALERLVAGS
ncbi:MAG: SRPBCC domain-containing protein [Acidimicrobiia bacterium]|nr:SRPBCC domain-containing protein [Acidimicrobiia bacterium]